MKDKLDTYSAVAEGAYKRTRRSRWLRMRLGFSKAPPTAWCGMIIILLYIICALFAPVIAPYGEAEVFPEPFAPWSSDFIFGTDQIGRDILSRMIYGARNTVSIAVATTALAFLIGGSMGLAAANNRSWLDQYLRR